MVHSRISDLLTVYPQAQLTAAAEAKARSEENAIIVAAGRMVYDCIVYERLGYLNMRLRCSVYVSTSLEGKAVGVKVCV